MLWCGVLRSECERERMGCAPRCAVHAQTACSACTVSRPVRMTSCCCACRALPKGWPPHTGQHIRRCTDELKLRAWHNMQVWGLMEMGTGGGRQLYTSWFTVWSSGWTACAQTALGVQTSPATATRCPGSALAVAAGKRHTRQLQQRIM